jgi:hypothetical protein
MTEKTRLNMADGTLVRHKVSGYEGRIEGTTEIKGCFTRGGAPLLPAAAKEQFQYRVFVDGESLRRIAPGDDLEILEEMKEIVCPACQTRFRTRPGLMDKPSGRCGCGGFICPSCWGCQSRETIAANDSVSPCPKERKRIARKLALTKRTKPSAGKKHLSVPAQR